MKSASTNSLNLSDLFKYTFLDIPCMTWLNKKRLFTFYLWLMSRQVSYQENAGSVCVACNGVKTEVCWTSFRSGAISSDHSVNFQTESTARSSSFTGSSVCAHWPKTAFFMTFPTHDPQTRRADWSTQLLLRFSRQLCFAVFRLFHVTSEGGRPC